MKDPHRNVRKRWIEAHAQFGETLRRVCHVSEDSPARPPCSIDERLVQCIWNDQFLRGGDLVTSSGKHIEVLEAGAWNTGRGPDFQNASFRLAGTAMRGDVEIHVTSQDWRRHSHHQDFEYNTVVLHVCLHAGDDRPYEEKQNGERLERLVLEPFLDPDLETLRRAINPDDYPYGRPLEAGICCERFLRMPEAEMRPFFQAAGRARLQEKIARFESQTATADLNQVLYQALMVGQGYKSNKTLYFLLSKRVPYGELLDHARDVSPAGRPDFILAALLHVAQLFPLQPDLFEGFDEESREYAGSLQEYWSLLRPYFRDRLLPPTRRWFSGMRPAGFPARRLTAIAFLLTRLADPEHPLFNILRDKVARLDPKDRTPKVWKRFYREAAALLEVSAPSHYFTTHFTLGGKPCRPQALLGTSAAQSLLFNVFLPLICLDARKAKDTELEKTAWIALERYPSLPKNSVTEFMRRRLFADSGLDKGKFRTELMQQALFKIFQDCCSQNERTCEDCTLLNPPYRPASLSA